MPLIPFHMVEWRHLGSFIDPDNMRFPFVLCCFQYLHVLSPTCHIGVKSTLQYQKTFYYFQAFQSPPNTIIWQLSISILSEISIKAVTKKLHFDCLLTFFFRIITIMQLQNCRSIRKGDAAKFPPLYSSLCKYIPLLILRTIVTNDEGFTRTLICRKFWYFPQ